MLANFITDGMVRHLANRGIRIVRDGSDLVLLGNFESLTAENVSILRSRKADLFAVLAGEDDTDLDPDGNPRPPPMEIVIGVDGGVGPPPANTATASYPDAETPFLVLSPAEPLVFSTVDTDGNFDPLASPWRYAAPDKTSDGPDRTPKIYGEK